MFQNYNQKLILDRDPKASTKRKSNWKEGEQCGNISSHAINKSNKEWITYHSYNIPLPVT